MPLSDDFNKYLKEKEMMGSTMEYTAWELEKWNDSKEIDSAPTTNGKTPIIITDMVKNPDHYKIFPDEEVIDLIRKCLTNEEFIGYCKGNILKYRLRDKHDNTEDFAKSKQYKEYLQDLTDI